MGKEFRFYARAASAPNQCVISPAQFLYLLTWTIYKQDSIYKVIPSFFHPQ